MELPSLASQFPPVCLLLPNTDRNRPELMIALSVHQFASLDPFSFWARPCYHGNEPNVLCM